MFFNTDFLQDGEIYLRCYKTELADEEKDYVDAYYFKIHRCCDKAELGFCELRVGSNEGTFYGGNIGYSVQEGFRGHHYALKATLLLLKLAKMHGMSYVIITCDPSNIASYKTIERAGGALLGVMALPKSHEMYSPVRTKTKRYKIVL